MRWMAGMHKEGGQTPYTPASLGTPVLNGHDWWPTSTVQRQVVLFGNGRWQGQR